MPGSRSTSTHGARARRVVLHVGPAKTGTTYLQRQLLAHRAWLAARGITYPETGREVGPGHHNLARHFLGEHLEGVRWSHRPPGDVVRGILRSSPGQVLLSSETFSGLSVEAAERLRSAIGDREVRVVVYPRRRSALCASHWQEKVKHGGCETFPEFLTGEILGPGAVLRFEDVLAWVLELFGKEALRAVVYDNLMLEGRDLFEHFVEEVLRLPADGIDPGKVPARVNPSLPEPVVEVLRVLNGVQPHRDEDAPLRLSTAAIAFLQSTPDGRALLSEVERIYDAEAMDLDLSRLDLEWLGRDHEILDACGPSVLNPAGPRELFREAEPRRLRVLSPDRLFRRIPYARFEELHAAIAQE